MFLQVLTRRDKPVVEAALNRHIAILAPGVLKVNADPFFSGRANVGFASPDYRALALFSHLGDNAYEGHLICDPPWRGREAIRFGREAVARIFTVCKASAITACIPADNRASRRVCRAIGGKPGADTVDSLARRCIRYKLERGEWEALSEVSRA